MNTRQVAKTFLIGIFVVGVMAVFVMNAYAHQQGGTHSLVNVSMKDIEDAALKYTHQRFLVLSDSVTIRFSRPVTKQELPLLGLPEIDFGGEDPPLALVVLMGEFDVRNLRSFYVKDTPWYVKFIAYVFDLKAGMPTLTMVSADGSMFRDLLNDPSLPTPRVDAIQIGEPENGVELPVPIAPATKLPYGAMEPPVPTPSGAPPPTEP